MLTCVTGVAGSGKSSLVAELIDTLRRRPAGGGRGGEVVVVDQRPVGRSSRSNPATYVDVFDPIRRAFAAANQVSPALFSFNAKGSCPKCKGRGFLEVELSFLDDVRLDCKDAPICQERVGTPPRAELDLKGSGQKAMEDGGASPAVGRGLGTRIADADSRRHRLSSRDRLSVQRRGSLCSRRVKALRASSACAEHDRQLGGVSPLSSLMAAKD